VVPFRYELADPSPYNYPLQCEPRRVREEALSDTFLVGKKTASANVETRGVHSIPLVIIRVIKEVSLLRSCLLWYFNRADFIFQSSSARTFVLGPVDPEAPAPCYRPGQFGAFEVNIPSTGSTVVRTWTLSSSPGKLMLHDCRDCLFCFLLTAKAFFGADLTTGRARFKDRTWSISITIKLKEGGLVSPLAVWTWKARE